MGYKEAPYEKDGTMYSGQGPHDPKGNRLSQVMMASAPYLSAGVLILIGPDFYFYTRDILWDFLALRYPGLLVYAAFFALYAMAYPAMFFLMRTAWQSSASIAALWAAVKLIT